MANFYLDDQLTTGANNGASFDDAFQDWYSAFEYNNYAPGDNIVVSRRSLFSGATKDLQLHADSDGTFRSWIKIIGWPRNYEDGTANFTRGSTTVTNPSWSITKLGYVGRKIYTKAGQWYLITFVNEGANTFELDRPYSGTTQASKSCRVIQDEFYGNSRNVDDSGWTIKISDWDNMTNRPPVINFQGSAYKLVFDGNHYIEINNLIIGNGQQGCMGIRDVTYLALKNCFFEQTRNAPVIIHESNLNRILLDRTVITGDSGSASQNGIQGFGGFWHIVDSAIYGCGGNALDIMEDGAFMFLDNVNIGVEVANGGDDFIINNHNQHWKEVRIGGSISRSGGGRISIENYGKEYLSDREFYSNGEIESITVSRYTGTPKRRIGGSDRIIKLTGNVSNDFRSLGLKETSFLVFEQRIWVDAVSRDYRLYVQADSMETATNELLMVVEYLAVRNDDGTYLLTQEESNQAISQRSDDEDWTQYLEVTGVEPEDEGWVTIRVYAGFYDADGILYIDPKVA